jgi:hypothetical protein
LKRVSPGDVKRGTGHAVELRRRVQAGPPGAKITKLFFTTRWPGTSGPTALLIHFTCPTLSLPTWRHLLTAPLGEWDDLHVFDDRGLLAFSTREEQTVHVRDDSPTATGRTEPGTEFGDELDPRVFAFLATKNS